MVFRHRKHSFLGMVGIVGFLFWSAPQAQAIHLLQTASTSWADPSSRVSVELSIPTAELSEDILQKLAVGGWAKKVRIARSPDLGWKLISAPMSAEELNKLQRKLADSGFPLERARPRVFVHSSTFTKNPETLVNVIRNLQYPEHREQIARFSEGDLSPVPEATAGFRKRISSESYNPSLRQLLEDAVYRQALEVLGRTDAWEMPGSSLAQALAGFPEQEVQSAFKKIPSEVFPALMLRFPSDPAVQLLRRSGFEPASALEISLHTSAMDLGRSAREASGIVSASEKYGAFDHDRLLYSQSGVSEETLAQLRDASIESQKKGKPLLFRYFLLDPKKPIPTGGTMNFEAALPHFEDAVVGRIPTTSIGSAPVMIPGNSVVFHDREFHGANILGRYNPGIINRNIVRAVGFNKYVEAQFFNELVPGSMPETRLLRDLGVSGRTPAEAQMELNRRFPGGWVMKGVNESSTGFSLVTSSADFGKLVSDYQKSDFDAFRARTLKELAGRDEDEVFLTLQKHPNYQGWKISEYLKNPQLAIVQKRLALDREFRVEAIGGKVLGHGSTLDRYAYVAKERGEKFESSSPETIAAIEKYTQGVLDRMPPQIRSTPFAFDIARLKDGSFAIIESNIGPESAFLVEEPVSIRALNALLRDYPKLVREGKLLDRGMSDGEQMAFLRDFFKRHGIDPVEQYPKYRFLKDRIDIGVPPLSPNPEYYSPLRFNHPVVPDRARCSELMSKLR